MRTKEGESRSLYILVSPCLFGLPNALRLAPLSLRKRIHHASTEDTRQLVLLPVQVRQFYEIIANNCKVLIFIHKATNLVAKDRSSLLHFNEYTLCRC
jgi:hypothetical protein